MNYTVRSNVHQISAGILVLLSFTAELYSLIKNLRTSNPYIYQDLLVNYSNGFVRRGLSGELISAISSFGVSTMTVVAIVLFLIVALKYWGVLSILKRGHRSEMWLICLLVLCPLGFSFYWFDTFLTGRREQLFLGVLIFVYSRRESMNRHTMLGLVVGTTLIGPLIHELIAIFSLYLVYVAYPYMSNLGRRVLMTSTIFSVAVLFPLLTLFFSGVSSVDLICQSIELEANSICPRAILEQTYLSNSNLGATIGGNLLNITINHGYLSFILMNLFIIFAIYRIILGTYWLKKIGLKVIVLLFPIIILPIGDSLRWLHSIYIGLTLCIFAESWAMRKLSGLTLYDLALIASPVFLFSLYHANMKFPNMGLLERLLLMSINLI